MASTMSQAQRFLNLEALHGGRSKDSSYNAAFYLLSYDPELYQVAQKCVSTIGVDFSKIKRMTKGFDEASRQLVDVAHNLFSWSSKCKVTPFDISRLPYPYLELVCNACYIAADQLEVAIEPEKDSLALDDKNYRSTQQFNQQIAEIQQAYNSADAPEELER